MLIGVAGSATMPPTDPMLKPPTPTRFGLLDEQAADLVLEKGNAAQPAGVAVARNVWSARSRSWFSDSSGYYHDIVRARTNRWSPGGRRV